MFAAGEFIMLGGRETRRPTAVGTGRFGPAYRGEVTDCYARHDKKTGDRCARHKPTPPSAFHGRTAADAMAEQLVREEQEERETRGKRRKKKKQNTPKMGPLLHCLHCSFTTRKGRAALVHHILECAGSGVSARVERLSDPFVHDLFGGTDQLRKATFDIWRFERCRTAVAATTPDLELKLQYLKMCKVWSKKATLFRDKCHAPHHGGCQECGRAGFGPV